MKLERCHSIADLQRIARRRLPWPIREFLEGGAGREWSIHNNVAAFSRWALVPRSLADVGERDLSARVFGRDLSWPVMLAPTGMSRLYHGHGELAVARAATGTGTLYSLGTFGSFTIEQVAEVCPGPKMFQLYINGGLERSLTLIDRAKAAGYDALCLTVDSAAAPNKLRDLRSGFDHGGVTPRGLLSILAHPRWVLGLARGGPLKLANLDVGAGDAKKIQWEDADRLSWDLALRIRDRWGGPFALKGILSPADAALAAERGVDAVILSNHGGRQMDALPAPVDMLPDVVDAVGDRLEVLIDSGVRHGGDVLKALALGAKGVFIGRPYLYGLAAGGEAGVRRALQILRSELERDMTLLGVPRLAQIERSSVRPAPPLPVPTWPPLTTDLLGT